MRERGLQRAVTSSRDDHLLSWPRSGARRACGGACAEACVGVAGAVAFRRRRRRPSATATTLVSNGSGRPSAALVSAIITLTFGSRARATRARLSRALLPPSPAAPCPLPHPPQTTILRIGPPAAEESERRRRRLLDWGSTARDDLASDGAHLLVRLPLLLVALAGAIAGDPAELAVERGRLPAVLADWHSAPVARFNHGCQKK